MSGNIPHTSWKMSHVAHVSLVTHVAHVSHVTHVSLVTHVAHVSHVTHVSLTCESRDSHVKMSDETHM